MTITVNNGRLARLQIDGWQEMTVGYVQVDDQALVAMRGDLAQVRSVSEARLDGVPHRVIAAEKGDVKGTVRLTLGYLPEERQ
jgi:hypothetical protein